jgi:UDP-N-acetylmuramoylalanine--D-glutamate ligase
MKIDNLKNKKIAILWFWKEGRSSLSFLLNLWVKDITILDKEISETEEKISWIKYISWNRYLSDLWIYDYIIKTPGISPFHKKIAEVKDKLISQTQIFSDNYTGKIIWITGTKGKSTVATLLYTMLKAAWYDVVLVWNIGSPVLDEIDLLSHEIHDFVVYEMSSYMLQDFVPSLYIWYFNNVYPCHLDWHTSLDIYKTAKSNILKSTTFSVIQDEFKQEFDTLNIDNPVYFDGDQKYKYNESWFCIGNELVFWTEQIGLKWEHNKKNILWVITILDIILQDTKSISKLLHDILPTFKWLPHRIEIIGEYEWIIFIDDAIATTPESTIAAIQSYEWVLQTLFLGWEDSGFDFKSIRSSILLSNIQNIVAFPDTSEKIFPEILHRDYEVPFEMEIDGIILQFLKTRSMKSWVDFAYKTTFPGRVALLSCAAPSFSLWKNYIEKANEFRKEVISY